MTGSIFTAVCAGLVVGGDRAEVGGEHPGLEVLVRVRVRARARARVRVMVSC